MGSILTSLSLSLSLSCTPSPSLALPQVRIAVCGALVSFWRAPADSSFLSPTVVGYMVDALLIHLDDGNEQVRG